MSAAIAEAETITQYQCAVTVVAHLDGVFTTAHRDIRRLVLETNSFREKHDELLLAGARLLRANHGLSNEDVAHAVVHVKVRVAHGGDCSRPLATEPEPVATRTDSTRPTRKSLAGSIMRTAKRTR